MSLYICTTRNLFKKSTSHRYMKTLFITLIVLLIGITSTAQIQHLVLENDERDEIHILEDNQMVRVVTINGERHKGKMQIVDANTISIKNALIPLTDIDKIKKHSKLVAVLLGTVVIYFSSVAIGAGVLIAIFGEVAGGAALTAVGILGVVGAANGINLNRAYKRYQGWTYRVETTQTVAIPQ